MSVNIDESVTSLSNSPDTTTTGNYFKNHDNKQEYNIIAVNYTYIHPLLYTTMSCETKFYKQKDMLFGYLKGTQEHLIYHNSYALLMGYSVNIHVLPYI